MNGVKLRWTVVGIGMLGVAALAMSCTAAASPLRQEAPVEQAAQPEQAESAAPPPTELGTPVEQPAAEPEAPAVPATPAGPLYKGIATGVTPEGFYFLGNAEAATTVIDYSDFL
jgi:hypothetical protein